MAKPERRLVAYQSLSELDGGRSVRLDVGQGLAIDLTRVDDQPWTTARSSDEGVIASVPLPTDWSGPEAMFTARLPGSAEIVVDGPNGSWSLAIEVEPRGRRDTQARAPLPDDSEVTWEEITAGRRSSIRSARGTFVKSGDDGARVETHFVWDEELGWSAFDEGGSGGVLNQEASYLIERGVAVRRYPPSHLHGMRGIASLLQPADDPRPSSKAATITSVQRQTVAGRSAWVLAITARDGRSGELAIDAETGIVLRLQSGTSIRGFESLEIDIDAAPDVLWEGSVDEARTIGRAYVTADPRTGLFSATIEQDAGPASYCLPLPDDVSFDEALKAARAYSPARIHPRIDNTTYDLEGSDPGRQPFPLAEVRRPPEVGEALLAEVLARTHWMRTDPSSAAQWVRNTAAAAGLDYRRCAVAVAERERDLNDNWPMTVLVAPDRVVWICDDDLDHASRHPDHPGELTEQHSARWQHTRVKDAIAAAMDVLDAEGGSGSADATSADS